MHSTSASTPLAPRDDRPKRRTFRHFRRFSQPDPPLRERSLSAYEAWIDSALLLAHSPDPTPTEPRETMPTITPTRVAETEEISERPQARQAPENDHSSNLQGFTKDEMPTIRLIPHQDPRANRPSLTFPPTTRTIPHEDCIIRVGRYSERDVNPNPVPNQPSSAPIGFKSKVVSRRHCEFWCSQGQWYIKDVKSSSGTFLNHIRLSQPNIESRPFPVNDGDVVQLGIDFRGGEEMIFRCVKIRIECNRGWQKTLNSYNVSTHKRLRDLGKTGPKKDSDAASTHSSQECSICLMPIAPCQSLFVAPCSHVWHYKCIRPILNDHKSWPQFLCPNCRAIHDLDADVDDPCDNAWEEEEEDQSMSEPAEATQPVEESATQLQNVRINGKAHEQRTPSSHTADMQDGSRTTTNLTTRLDETNSAPASSNLFTRRTIGPTEQGGIRLPSGSGPFLQPIAPTQPLMSSEETLEGAQSGTPTMDMLVNEGPMTPTNTAGPFVFDGSAGRRSTVSSDASAAAA